MTRADLVWAAAFALAARDAPNDRWVVTDTGVERVRLTDAEIRAYCEREAERAVAVLGAT